MTTSVKWIIDLTTVGGDKYDQVTNIGKRVALPYVNVDLPTNVQGFTISLAFYTTSGDPYNLTVGSSPTDISMLTLRTTLGDVINPTNLSVSADQTGQNITNQVDFVLTRSSVIPMPIYYTINDSSNSDFANIEPLIISYGGVSISSSTSTLTYGSTGTVNVQLFQDVLKTTLYSRPSAISVQNMPAQLGINYLPIYDNLGHTRGFANSNGVYNDTTKTVSFTVSDPHPNPGLGNSLSLTYTPFAIPTTFALLYPTNVTNVVIIYNGTAGTAVPCFFGNAPVLTPSGYKRIDSLKKGDNIISTGGIQSIKEIICYNVEASVDTNPYLIPKGMFKAREDLLISPDHSVKVKGEMIRAKHLGLERINMEGTLTYYNIRLNDWHNMFVAGVEVETFVATRMAIMTLEAFNQAIKEQCGTLTPELQKQINSKIKYLDNNMVACPVYQRI
jgi:hypothetical protein